ncbi:MAG: fimbrillin family protein, partial [Candidatus Cryptobacteroides sp.]
MKRFPLTLSAALLVAGCNPDFGIPAEDGSGRVLEVKIEQMRDSSPAATKVSYGGTYGEHSEFEIGDWFGLFVFDDEGIMKAANKKVYCSGYDNDGKTVWSIYKEGSSDGNSSNYPLSEILGLGHQYFAYFPYDDAYGSLTSLEEVKSIVSDFPLPTDQSSAFTEYDFLVASNVPDCEYGEVVFHGKQVGLTFGHTMAMLRFFLPTGSVKYDYVFDGKDFTPSVLGTDGSRDECRYLFKPGCALDFCVKYVYEGKLYKFETGKLLDLWPVTTVAGHCYFHDDKAAKVPYNSAVDMGTSALWASFNIGAEDDASATHENIGTLKGDMLMWGVNQLTGTVGSAAYTKYNSSFSGGTKPSELPVNYDYSGDVRYDAARNLWGGEWRTPTQAEWKELFAACTCTVSNNIITFTSKTTGNSISLVYAGYDNG